MSRHKKTNRGLSTVVTGAILLSAVAIMGIMVVAWANTKHFQIIITKLTKRCS